jgi:sec-independent protein translocase protein TatA
VFDISPIQILMVAVIALLVFGPKRLPEIGRMMGRGVREFRSVTSLTADDPPPRPAPRPAAAAPAAADDDDVLEGVVVPAGTPAPQAAAPAAAPRDEG